MKPAREPASSRPKPCAFLKKPHESCPFAAPCGPRRKKNDRGQRSAFPSETSRFKPVILAHRGSALPWLVNDRAALRLRLCTIQKSHMMAASIKHVDSNIPTRMVVYPAISQPTCKKNENNETSFTTCYREIRVVIEQGRIQGLSCTNKHTCYVLRCPYINIFRRIDANYLQENIQRQRVLS